jgi:hypothetical protein
MPVICLEGTVHTTGFAGGFDYILRNQMTAAGDTGFSFACDGVCKQFHG